MLHFGSSKEKLLLAAACVATLGISALPADAADPFLVGALNPISGAGSPYGSGMQKAIAMAADEINAGGGVCERQIELISEDTQTSPDAAVLAAKKLVEVNKVNAVLGTWSSGVTLRT